MGEEQGNTGDRGNQRIVTLLKSLGWDKQGKSDVGISCSKRKHDSDTHGVDAYFSYDDPYLPSHSSGRGVLVESKSKKWDSWDGTELNNAVTQARQTLECSIESDEFREKLDDDKDRTVNASIVAAWVNDEDYNAEKFQGYIEGCETKPLAGGPYYVLVLDNDHLDRLASISQHHNEISLEYSTEQERITNCEFGFYYPALHEPKSEPKLRSALSFDYLFSDYIYSKLEYSELTSTGQNIENHSIGIVYNSNGISFEDMSFLYQSLFEYGFLECDEIWVYNYGDTTEERDTVQDSVISRLEENIIPDTDDSPEFYFESLTHVEYKSYANDLLGETDG